MAGWFPFFSAALASSGFSGGRSQVNPNSYGELVFANIIHSAQGWHPADNAAWGNVADYNFDANGYPQALSSGGVGVSTLVVIPNNNDRPWVDAAYPNGTYKLTWKGAGRVTVSGFDVITGSRTSTTSAGGSVTLTPNYSSRVEVGIDQIGSGSYVHDIKLYHMADEQDIIDGKVFNQVYRNRIMSAKFGVFRQLNWGGDSATNFSNVALWSHRKPAGHIFWNSHEIRGSLPIGRTSHVTASGQTTYTFNDSSGAVFHGKMMHVQWDIDAAGYASSLTHNGSTKRIMNMFSVPPEAGAPNSGMPAVDMWFTLVFDSVIDAWIAWGVGGAGPSSQFLDNGVPPEIFLQACIEIGCHPWVVTPPLATDPAHMNHATDSWVKNFAAYIRDNGPSWMKPIWEGANEPWNGQFPFYWWASQRQYISVGGNPFWQGPPTTPFVSTAFTNESPSAGKTTFTMSGALPPVGALVVGGKSQPPGVSGFNLWSGYVTSSGSGQIVVDATNGGGSFSPTSGACTFNLSTNVVTLPVAVITNTAIRFTGGTLPHGGPTTLVAGTVYYAVTPSYATPSTTVQLTALEGEAVYANSQTPIDFGTGASQSGSHTAEIVEIINISQFDEPNWLGTVSSHLGQTIAATYGVSKANVKTQTKYDITVGCFTSGGTSVSSLVGGQDPVLTARAYVLQATPYSGFAADAASEWVTAINISNYFNSAAYRSGAQETALAAAAGLVKFRAGISGGTMTVETFDPTYSGDSVPGTVITAGGIIFGPSGVTMDNGPTVSAFGTSGTTGTGEGGTYKVSNTSLVVAPGTVMFCLASKTPLQTYIDSSEKNSFTGSVASGGILTVSTTPTYPIYAGSYTYGDTALNNLYIQALGTSGTTGTGGTGTYALSNDPGVIASKAMYTDLPASVSGLGIIADNFKTWAKTHSVTQMFCYEGGYSPDYADAHCTNPVDMLRMATKLVTSSPRYPLGMQTTLANNYAAFDAITDGTFTFKWPSCFQFEGQYPSFSDWSICENIYMQPDSPQLKFIISYNA